jgi:hypothetical protein
MTLMTSSTDGEIAHAFTDGIDDARSLVAQTRWKFDGLDVVVDPPHGFGAFDADCLNIDAGDLIWTRGRPLGLDELQNFRPSGPYESTRA